MFLKVYFINVVSSDKPRTVLSFRPIYVQIQGVMFLKIYFINVVSAYSTVSYANFCINATPTKALIPLANCKSQYNIQNI